MAGTRSPCPRGETSLGGVGWEVGGFSRHSLGAAVFDVLLNKQKGKRRSLSQPTRLQATQHRNAQTALHIGSRLPAQAEQVAGSARQHLTQKPNKEARGWSPSALAARGSSSWDDPTPPSHSFASQNTHTHTHCPIGKLITAVRTRLGLRVLGVLSHLQPTSTAGKGSPRLSA